VYRALSEFGAPLRKDGLGPEDFASEDVTYQIGIAPLRIDILTHLSGIEFAEAWPNRVASIFFGLPAHFISLNDLIINKKAAGRSSDFEHLEHFQKEMGNKNRKE
jgi:hypothetical protein